MERNKKFLKGRHFLYNLNKTSGVNNIFKIISLLFLNSEISLMLFSYKWCERLDTKYNFKI